MKYSFKTVPKKRLYLGSFLAISSLWLYANRATDSVISDIDTRPDYELLNAHYISTDTKGDVTTRLQSEKIIKQQKDDFSTALNPIVTTGTSYKSYWEIRAKSAYMPESLEYVLLEGETDIFGTLTEDKIHAKTSELKIFSQDGIANTEQKSTLLSHKINLTGDGMTIHLKNNSLELHHNVKGSLSITNHSL